MNPALGALALAVGGAVAVGARTLASTPVADTGATATPVDSAVHRSLRLVRSAVTTVRREFASVRGAAGAVSRPDQNFAEAGAAPAGAKGFVPALEGLRAAAAVGVLTTHVAFLTRSTTGNTLFRVFGRLDLSVAVFFALSGFLLWRTHARQARSGRPGTARPTREYLRSRLVRIMPAYVVLVAAAMTLLPANHVNGLESWLRNLTLTQIYQGDFLVAGLTHAWSLAVEMAFYLCLPLFWTAMVRLRGAAARWRIPALLGFGATGLVFPLVPWHALGLPAGINDQILPPAFASWFAAGMILAELAAARPGIVAAACRGARARWGWWTAAAATLVATTLPVWFSEGFVHPGPLEFAARNGLASLLAFLVLAPVVLAPKTLRFPLLESELAQALGRWSYGIFLWHLLVLLFAFQLTGIPLWSGHMPLLWAITTVGSVAVAALSYALVEEPARRALER